MKAKAYNIKWDVDDKEDLKALPKEVVIEIPEDEDIDTEDEDEVSDYVSDYLSNEYGFCHNGFSLNLSQK